MTPTAASEDPDSQGTSGPGRTEWPTILIAVATVLTVVATFTTWVRVQALDTEEWVRLSSELLEEPEIRGEVAAFLVDEMYQEVDVATQVEGFLPESLQGLAGPMSAALRGPAIDAVDRLLDTAPVRAGWARANETAHGTAVAILRDDTPPGVSTADGAVTLDLGELVVLVAEDFGFSADLLDDLPDDTGRIVIFESDELDQAQATVRVLDFLSWFLFLIVVGLFALAVYLAYGRRLIALRSVGLGLLVAGVSVLILRRLTVAGLVGSVVEDSARRPVAEVGAFVSTGLLRQMGWAQVFYGLLIVGFVALLGHRPFAVAVRRTLSPALSASPSSVAGATIVLLLLLVWWSPGRAFNSWVTGITLVSLVAGAVVGLRRQVLTEFPDHTFDDVLDDARHRFKLGASPSEDA
ncbi:MAG: hypothetical protein GY698_17215 [Actinomycetia bacterium]|nr:hypothetical protein [Actinomycetes bacterium]